MPRTAKSASKRRCLGLRPTFSAASCCAGFPRVSDPGPPLLATVMMSLKTTSCALVGVTVPEI